MEYWSCASILLLILLELNGRVSSTDLISESCFECLCEAASGCDVQEECFNKGPGQYLCGPYHISYSYWNDAGKPGADPEDPLDFEKCLNTKPCAESAVRGYMNRWKQDCDGNNVIDCLDIARIHMTGPYGCNSSWVLGTDYWTRFMACRNEIS